MTIELFMAAANNQVKTVQRLLSNPNININFKAPNGMTSLHAAAKSRHTEVVRVLLEHGARKDIKDNDNNTVMDFTKDNLNQEIFDLLHPELAVVRLTKEQMVQAEIDQFISEHKSKYDTGVNKEVLKELAVQYIQSDRAETIPNSLEALKYMYNALSYMILELLKAKKYETVSRDAGTNYDAQLNHYDSAYEMLQSISACVGYLRKNDAEKLNKLALSNIHWKALALFARENQYNPNFISNLNYAKKAQLINKALSSILDAGEFNEIANHIESLIKSIESVQGLEEQKTQLESNSRASGVTKETKKQNTEQINHLRAQIVEKNSSTIDNYEPKLLATLIGFIKDEHSAQCIKNATTIISKYFSTKDNWPSMLNCLIKIGEALDNASPKLKNLFNPKSVQDVVSVRNLLCHPEIPENSAQIKNILTNGKSVVIISSNKFDLMQLAKYWGGQSKLITKFLAEIYVDDLPADVLWNKIKDVANHYLVSKDVSSVQKYYEVDELSYLESKSFKTINDIIKICKLKPQRFEDECREKQIRLKAKMEKSLNSAGFTYRIKAKLKKPEESLQDAVNYLQTNEEAYKEAQNLGEMISEKEKELITTYENVQSQQKLWKKYNDGIKVADNKKDKQTQDLLRWKNAEINKIISHMLKEYIRYAKNVGEIFEEINTTHAQLTKKIDMIKAEKIGSLDFEHSKLEFYQIMVGSIARGLLEAKDKVEDFGKILPKELCDILKETVIASRSYLAHIGMRQEGKAVNEAIDRPKVFLENSKKIIESVQLVTKLAQVQELTLNKDLYDFLAIKDGLKKKGVIDENILNPVDNNEQLCNRLNEINKPNHIYMIPLNVNGIDGSFTGTLHWAGLYISTDEHEQITQIKYINPIGQKINQDLINTVLNHIGIAPQDVTAGKGIQFAYVSKSGIELEGNTYDCGPLLVQLLSELFHHNGLIQTPPQNHLESILLGQKCRKEQSYEENELIGGIGTGVLNQINTTTEIDADNNSSNTLQPKNESSTDIGNNDQPTEPQVSLLAEEGHDPNTVDVNYWF